MPPPDDIASALLARAEEDVALVRSALEEPKISDAIVGFHAQQAAEKLLKALLVRSRVAYPFTHDIERLMELLETETQRSIPQRDAIVDLTPWAVEFRYGEIPSDELDREATLVLLDQLLVWAQDQLD